jgi:hypothetical protein
VLGSGTGQTLPIGTATEAGAGCAGSGDSNFYDGLMDELRVATVLRSADWVKTEYDNQKPGSTFISVGAEEAL